MRTAPSSEGAVRSFRISPEGDQPTVDRFKLYINFVAALAVPVMAFVIRMARGDTKNENEALISQLVRGFLANLEARIMQKGTAPA